MRGQALACTVAVAATGAPGQTVAFRGVGDLPGGPFASRALGVAPHSAIVVVGESQTAGGWRAFRWSPGSGMQELGVLASGDAFSRATDASISFATPPVIVGSSGFAPSVFEASAFRWTEGGMQALGPFAGGGIVSLAHAISDDALVIVGEAGATPGGPRAFRWTQATGAVGLGTLPGGGPDNSAAHDVSWNGEVIVGHAQNASLQMEAFRWTPEIGMVGLGHLNSTGFKDSRAFAMASVGDAIVGESTSPNGPQEAFRWTSGSMVGLGDLPGGAFRSAALAASNGEIVGWSETAAGNRAFTWDQTFGMRDLRQVLEDKGANLVGWTLTEATAISASGRLVVGTGINPLGQPEGWVADFGCYPDCNGDGLLTVADWGCFQTRFVQGDLYSDCDGSSILTVADFGCYRTKFVQGCS